MTHLTAKKHKDGVELKVVLTKGDNESLREAYLESQPALKYSEREIEIATKAFTQGRCSKESLEQYLKRIGAK